MCNDHRIGAEDPGNGEPLIRQLDGARRHRSTSACGLGERTSFHELSGSALSALLE
jgi:hypothetical protein